MCTNVGRVMLGEESKKILYIYKFSSWFFTCFLCIKQKSTWCLGLCVKDMPFVKTDKTSKHFKIKTHLIDKKKLYSIKKDINSMEKT